MYSLQQSTAYKNRYYARHNEWVLVLGACATLSIADVLFEVEVGRLFGAKADNHMNEIWSYIMTNHRM